MTEKDYLKYWLKTSQDDLEAAESLIKAKKYSQGLFFCNLALEKLIKGLVYKNTKSHALPIHDFLKLFYQAKIKISDEQKLELKEINNWNIRARYDNIKRDFYKKATKKFTEIWFNKVKKWYLWLKEQY